MAACGYKLNPRSNFAITLVRRKRESAWALSRMSSPDKSKVIIAKRGAAYLYQDAFSISKNGNRNEPRGNLTRRDD
jgi:hypothetical protein